MGRLRDVSAAGRDPRRRKGKGSSGDVSTFYIREVAVRVAEVEVVKEGGRLAR